MATDALVFTEMEVAPRYQLLTLFTYTSDTAYIASIANIAYTADTI